MTAKSIKKGGGNLGNERKSINRNEDQPGGMHRNNQKLSREGDKPSGGKRRATFSHFMVRTVIYLNGEITETL